MKKICMWLLLATFSITAFGQDTYWIEFTDKANSPFSLSNPQDFLSARAIARRNRQGIPLDQHDLPVNPAYLTALRNTGAEVIHWSKWLNGATVRVTSSQVLLAIQNLPFVAGFGPSSRKAGSDPNTVKKFQVDHEILPRLQVFDSIYYAFAWNQVKMLNLQFLHARGYKGQGKLMAVFDSGFPSMPNNRGFNSLFNQNKIKYTFDYVTMTPDVYGADSHGALTFSCIAGSIPGEFEGTGPEADYLLFRTENAPTEYIIEEDNWIAAAEKADSLGADVFSTSLGYYEFDNPAMNHTIQDLDGNTIRISKAAKIAAQRGILVCNSAGNNGSGSWRKVIAPADADSIFSVGAVNFLGQRVSFSSTGNTADGRIKPSLMAQGSGSAVIGLDGQVSFANGTSFSCPIFAGALVSLWSAIPEASWRDVYTAVLKSCDRFNSPDSLMGHGIPDFKLAYALLGGDTSTQIALNNNSIAIVPNPLQSNSIIQIDAESSGLASLSLYTSDGKALYQVTLKCNKGINEFEQVYNWGALQAGVYIVSYQIGNKSGQIKVLKY